MSNFKISIIICTYNRANLIVGALKSLDEQNFDKEDYEIIVVDDGSTDNTSEIVSKLSLKANLQYFKRPHICRAAARNFGLEQAKGEYVLFVDDDILAPSDLLEEHYKFLSRRHKIVVRGPVIDTPLYEIPSNSKPKAKDFSMAFFCTCNASVKKESLLDIGGFDESFTEYGWEDTELGLRLREAGLKVKFNFKARVYHYKPEAPDFKEEIQKVQELGRMAVAFYKKHPNLRVSLATGLHPVLIFWQRLSAGWPIRKIAEKLISNKKISQNSRLNSFLRNKILASYYLESVISELKK